MSTDTILKIGLLCGALMTIGTFCYKVYTKILKPLCIKLTAFIDSEIELREHFREMYEWYQKMRVYADVRVLPKYKSAAAGEGNGEAKH